MAQTASSLSQTLRQVWTKESFRKAFELEIQDAQEDMRQQHQFTSGLQGFTSGLQGQVRFTGEPGQVYVGILPRGIDMSPRAIQARRARQDQMLQLVAAKKRGNKPSYRQRQKNGRAGRKK